LLRHKFKEYSEMERDLQRIAIRRFFGILNEIKGKKRRGSLLINILRMYKFEQEDLINFLMVFEELKEIDWVRRLLDGDKK
ncbi:hypothetical protein H5T89_07460, partial [bacterium]|nr:hypothetical protein [bacterium]